MLTELRSNAHSLWLFAQAFAEESWRGIGFNRAVRKRVVAELRRRGVDVRSAELATAWREFDKQLLRPRPRLLAFVSAYAMLTSQPYQAIVDQGGMLLFRTFWGLAAIQDDLIDDIPTHAIAALPDQQQRIRGLYGAIFGPDRVFYRAAYRTIIDEMERVRPVGAAEQHYLKTKLADWYRFLTKQEAEVVATDPRHFSFDFCRSYREQQDRRVTGMLAACLNGAACLDPAYQQLESVMPWLAYRSQMIDDLADTTEDLAAGRPSYAVGAINEYPAERRAVDRLLVERNVAKVPPRVLKSVAPRSHQLLKNTFAGYGQALVEREGFRGRVLDAAGWGTFHAFPVIRDVMYQINPRYANF